MPVALTRRRFAVAVGAAFAARALRAQSALTNVAAIERPRVLAEAAGALGAPTPTLLSFSTTVSCLTAAFVLTGDERYASRAGEHLATWLLHPATRLSPQPEQSVVALVPLAEIARSTSFLVGSTALPEPEFAAVNQWFADLLLWMNTAHDPLVERDRKDHRASAWLLLAAAIARSQKDEKALDSCSHLFRKPTLRNEVRADGSFPEELATANPYRNTLFNFDLLAGACQLLSSPFDDLWDYELMDGPGMRSVAAFLYPLIGNRSLWPYVSDAEHFRELPGRRPGLLFAGRAFNRPEYVQLWQALPPAIPEDLAESFPIRQPLLWTARAPHGF